MTEFKVIKYSDVLMAIVKSEDYAPPISGLPPTHTQCIMLHPKDLTKLIGVLQNANEG
jgi:hypothetical protein